jgi:hypothetical protein
MLRLIILLSLLGTCGYSAPESTAGVSPSFIAIACDQPIDAVYYTLNSKKIAVHLPIYEAVGPLSCGLERTLKFFRKDKSPVPGSDEYKVIDEINLPVDSELNILLFKTNRDGSYGIKVYPCSKDSFPVGHVRFVNLSSSLSALKLNEEVVILKPDEFKIVPTVKSCVKYAVAVSAAAGWVEAINGFGVVDEKSRLTVFVTDSKSDFFKSEVAPGVFLNRTQVNAFQVRH